MNCAKCNVSNWWRYCIFWLHPKSLTTHSVTLLLAFGNGFQESRTVSHSRKFSTFNCHKLCIILSCVVLKIIWLLDENIFLTVSMRQVNLCMTFHQSISKYTFSRIIAYL